MKRIVTTLIALILIAALAYWFSQQRVQTTSDKTVKIGVILPLTGDAASYGTSLKKGLDLAFSDSDAKLIYEDSKGESKTAVSIINKLINTDKVNLLIGDMFTNTTMAIAPIANKNNLLLLTPTASSSEISEKGTTTFRLYPSEKEEGELLYNFSQKKFPNKKSSIIVVNEDAMLKVAEIINKNSTNQVIEYAKGILDYTSILQKIDNNTEIVFLIGYFDDCAQLIKQSIELKKHFSFICLSTVYTPQINEILGNINVPIYISAPASTFDMSNPLIENFVQQYATTYKEQPDIWAGYGYDAGKIIQKVMNESKQNGTSYIDEMYKIADFNGVTGTTTINKDRSINKSMDMVEYANGNFSAIKY